MVYAYYVKVQCLTEPPLSRVSEITISISLRILIQDYSSMSVTWPVLTAS